MNNNESSKLLCIQYAGWMCGVFLLLQKINDCAVLLYGSLCVVVVDWSLYSMRLLLLLLWRLLLYYFLVE